MRAGQYIIVDTRTMDYMKDKDGRVICYDSLEDACGMYEFENAWVCRLEHNHIDAETKNNTTRQQ